MNRKSCIIGNRTITYFTVGSGNPVMLVHGFGEDSRVWENQVSVLQDHYLLIIPDLPGSGDSELMPDTSMEAMAAVLEQILLQELISVCCMIGHSMGGYVTLAYAEAYGDRLNGFGLFHSSAYADSEEKKATRRKGIAFIREHGAFEFLKTAIPNLFAPDTKENRPDLVAGFLEQQRNFSADALVQYYEAMIARPDRTKMLIKNSFPILFILGMHDMAVPLKDGLEQCHLPDLSYIHTFKESGHMGMLEEPKTTGRVLLEFLNSVYSK